MRYFILNLLPQGLLPMLNRLHQYCVSILASAHFDYDQLRFWLLAASHVKQCEQRFLDQRLRTPKYFAAVMHTQHVAAVP